LFLPGAFYQMMNAVNSLVGRLLLASAVLLPLLLGFTGVYLDRSFRLSVEAAEVDRLHLQIVTLLAEAEYDRALYLPEQLLEPRFNRPDSGLYAIVNDKEGRVLWSSPSALLVDVSSPLGKLQKLAIGASSFSRGERFFHYAYQVVWETSDGMEVPLRFTVLEHIDVLDTQVAIYRRGLLLWLGGTAVLLLLAQTLILFWGLRPLRSLAGDITNIESGASGGLLGSYPREVQALTDSLNTLLRSEKKRRERARNTLSDLAHSLKTPLAVMRSADADEQNYSQLVNEQAQQMEQIVSYQLQRAVGASHHLLQMVSVLPVAQRLKASLMKVYADKGVNIELAVDAHSVFRGDERDLLELLGILMDNACKYGRSRVRVSATGGDAQPLLITVEDDGDGIPAQLRKAILKRGVRADSLQTGHGIGLAVAVDLAENYLGTLELAQSGLGGAHLRVELP
jgi:two-component system sensor histidine kinase PhoQ